MNKSDFSNHVRYLEPKQRKLEIHTFSKITDETGSLVRIDTSTDRLVSIPDYLFISDEHEDYNSSRNRMDDDFGRGIPSSVSSYEKGRIAFEKMNAFKEAVNGRRILSASEMSPGCVRDRKKFFESRINELKLRDNVVSPPAPSICAPPKDTLSMMDESSSSPSVSEERTDAECKSHIMNNRTDPEPSGETLLSKLDSFASESDIEPSDLFRDESEFCPSKGSQEPELGAESGDEYDICDPDTVSRRISLSQSYIQKVDSLDEKMVRFLSSSDDEGEDRSEDGDEDESESSDTETEEIRTAQERTRNHIEDEDASFCVDTDSLTASDISSDIPAHSTEEMVITEHGRNEIPEPSSARQHECGKNDKEVLTTANSEPFYPTVKIQVTTIAPENSCSEISTTRRDKSTLEGSGDKSTQEGGTSIDEIIKEFRRVSSQMAENLLSNANLPSSSETKSCDSDCPLNPLSPGYFQEMRGEGHVINKGALRSANAKKLKDRKGSKKGSKSQSSSDKQKFRGNNGMGKMLKRAGRGMGKSMKTLTAKSVSQITQLTSTMKSTMKTKPKTPGKTQQKSVADGYRISVQDNSKHYFDFFDEKLAAGLMSNHKGLSRASQYLVTGKRLLHIGARTKRENDLKGYKDFTRKAHTYAFVARQLAKQYLLKNRNDIFIGTGMNPSDLGSTGGDDGGISVLEDIFYSLLRCVGPCEDDENMVMSRFQVDDTLEILSKVSEEETLAINDMVSQESKKRIFLFNDNKEEVRAAMTKALLQTSFDGTNRERDTAHNRNVAIRRFVSELQSFYTADTSLDLADIIEMELTNFKRQRQMDDTASSWYSTEISETTGRSIMSDTVSYSEPLMYDFGQSNFFTRSFGSKLREQPSSQQDRPEEESLIEGIRPGTTVLSVSVKNKDSEEKFANSKGSNKKKFAPSRKWLPGRGRKTKQ